MKIFLIRTPDGLRAADEEAQTYLGKIAAGQTVKAEVTRARNIKFHRKFFAMLAVGFDAWEPPEQEFRGMPVQKSAERFRKDCLIAAGFYEPVVNLKGEVRAEAKSIAFDRMAEDEFEKVYSAVADVLLERVLRNYTRDDLDQVVAEIIGFT